MIYIYSIKGCKYCDMAKKLAKSLNLPHKIIYAKNDKDKQKMKEKHLMNTFPQIFFKNSKGDMVKIGGYTDFEKVVEFCGKL